MRVWLITTGEPLPIFSSRPHRTGMLADELANSGHEVTWWTTTFDHQLKSYLGLDKISSVSKKHYKVNFLHSKFSYKKNISIRRILNHHFVSKRFSAMAKNEDLPDLVYCSFPTIDLSYEAVKLCSKNNIPVIIDVRDLWPDIFLNPFPSLLRPLIRLFLISYFHKTEYVFNNCSSITAVSNKYLEWSLNYAGRNKRLSDNIFPLGYYVDKDTNLNEEDAEAYYTSLSIDPNKTIVWFVGTFGQTYDLTTVISAAAKLKDTKDVQFVLTGNGERMQMWKSQAEGLDNVCFTGWVDQNKLKYLSNISDIGLMAYSKNASQGLPNKVFEYMSHGIPILSSLQSETKDLIEEHNIGLTYVPENSDSLENKLKILLDSKQLRDKMSKKSKNLFNEQYSSNVVYKKLVEYLEGQVGR